MSMNTRFSHNRLRITPLLVSLLLIIVSASLASESPCDNSELSEHNGAITITGIVGIRVMRHNDDLTWSPADDTTATPAESLRILIEMDHLRQPEKSSAVSPQLENTPWQKLAGSLRLAVRNSLISTAHACQNVNSATLETRLDLVSSENYRGNVAGDSLRNEFSVYMVPFNGIEPDNSVFWYRPISIGTLFSASSSTPRPAFKFRFEPTVRESQTSGGTTNQLHRFTFSIELDNGELFTLTSAPVLIAI